MEDGVRGWDFKCDNNFNDKKLSWKTKINLAFLSMGVVYGDIGTSPLYVYSNIFHEGINTKDDVIGALSLIIYTLVLVVLVKYVLVVLNANDHGEGGTFALYSLICRNVRIRLIPSDEADLSDNEPETRTAELERARKIKRKLENSKAARIILFFLTIMGTSMVISDGVLTPSISVLSAVGGIKSLGQDVVVGVSVAILVLLFSIQRFGTDKLGLSFAPVILVWFTFLVGIGVYNLCKHDIGVLRAVNPIYIVDYFRRNGKKGWISLGSVFLCITGTEAMFADLGHFTVQAIQISFSFVTFPSLILIYSGQASYLSKHPDKVSNTFYASVPGPFYWPTFVVAVAATIIASQAMISGVFSIVSQSLRLGCFPNINVVHTSAKYGGRVYIPVINYLLMLACVVTTVGFKTTEKMGNAYGIAVVTVLLITTVLVSLIMLVVWKTSVWWIVTFSVVFISIEIVFLSSMVYKFRNGGFVPLVVATVLMTIMAVWHYVGILKCRYELREAVSDEFIRKLARNPSIKRVPGIGFLYTELTDRVSLLFSHYVSSVSSVHSIFILVSTKSLPVSRVAAEDRFFFRRIEPKKFWIFRCVVRYGYNDEIEETSEFESQVVHNLKEFVRREYNISRGEAQDEENDIRKQPTDQVGETSSEKPYENHVSVASLQSSGQSTVQIGDPSSEITSESHVFSASPTPFEQITSMNDYEFVDKARENGMFYLMGETEVRAESNSSILKKFVVDTVYNFLSKNCRKGDDNILAIPRSKLLKIGMIYEI